MAALALVLAAWGCSALSQGHAASHAGRGVRLGGGGGGGRGGGPGGRHTGAVGRIGGGFHGSGLLDFEDHDKSQGVFGSLGAGVYGGIGQALGVRAVHDSSQGSSAFGRASGGGSHQQQGSLSPTRAAYSAVSAGVQMMGRGSPRVSTSWPPRSAFEEEELAL